jgi:DNA-binding NtrC family response regulator
MQLCNLAKEGTMPQLQFASVVNSLTSSDAITCPIQILVIDRVNGPANVLVDTISLLLRREVSVTSVDEHADALRALDYYHFDLVVVGLQENQPVQLTILPHIHRQNPDRPILAVGRDLPRLIQQYAHTYGAREVLNMPERSADLKTLVAQMAERYLRPLC